MRRFQVLQAALLVPEVERAVRVKRTVILDCMGIRVTE